MKITRYFFLLLLQITGFASLAQHQNIKFESLGTEKGLSQSNVVCILQDSHGFMWFGTRDGLNKYDGYKFTIYKNIAGDKTSISNNYIQGISESKNGDLWIATWGGGLNKFDRETNRFITYKHDAGEKNSISSNFLNSVLEDSRGNIWIGTEDAGLDMLDPLKNQFIHYTPGKSTTSLSDVFVRNVFEDSRHDIWIATGNGGLNLLNKDKNTFTRFQHDAKNKTSVSSNDVYTMFEDSQHRFWIGTNGGGLELLNRETREFYHYQHDNNNPNSIANNFVHAINEDSKKNLWVGTENGGLSILDSAAKSFQTHTSDEFDDASLGSNSIYSIYKDNRDNLWIGTFNAGVNLVSRDISRFIHYKHLAQKNSLSHNKVLCIYEDSEKNIWIGTDGGGVNLFDAKTGKFTCYRHDAKNKNSICGDYVLSICEDSQGNLWFGTWADGITVFNKKKNTYRHFKNNPDDTSTISSNNAWTIFVDKEKSIWVGTFGGGLELFNPANNSFTHFKQDAGDMKGIGNSKIHSIFQDSEGYVWISTDGGGLNRFDKKTGTFIHFLHDDKKNSIANNSVNNMHEDADGNLWIGTVTGLSFLNKKTNLFTTYTTADGLPSNVISGILEDDKKNLWISTYKGITCFNPRTKEFKNFTTADGLQSDEFKLHAYYKSRSGAMYFGGNNGFNQFFPDKIKDDPFESALVFTDFLIFNKKVPIAIDDTDQSPLKKDISETQAISLSYKSSVISFEFASLNYTSPEKKLYAYMLEGFDNTWNDVGTQHTATYTNLNPGTYVFKVKGMNNDGSWAKSITSMKLTIRPPFWQTWWFRICVIAFVLACFVAFYRMRMQTVTKQKMRLEKQVKERTAQVVMQKEELSRNVQELAVLKEDLEKEKYYLDSLMDNMPDSIYFKDKESKLIRVSKFMADRFSGVTDDLIGKSDFDFQNADHAKRAWEDEQEIQKTRTPKIDYLEKELREDGKESWVSTTKMPLINAQGEVVGTFGMSRDVTQIKMLEQERHDAILDKAVAQGKFEIASDVMHDIGNAVVGFGAYITRIKRSLDGNHPEQLEDLSGFLRVQQPALSAAMGEAKAGAVVSMLTGIAESQKSNEEEIKMSITEQLNIITHIQEILSIQRQYIDGQNRQERKAVNIRHIINDSLSMVLPIIEKKGINVTLNVAADLPGVKGDRTRLMQLILNILKNSIEAFDPDTDDKTILVNAFTHKDHLILQIKDNGDGFDAAIAKRLFERGFTTKPSGSGLGLYNCLTIVESHEGDISLTSEGEKKGALATIGLKI